MDVYIVDCSQNDIILLVQEDKRFDAGDTPCSDAQAQLITEATATFTRNNNLRVGAGGEPVEHKVRSVIVPLNEASLM